MNIKKQLGNRIREIRVNCSLTQEALAEKINLSPKSLSQIELGNNFVSAEILDILLISVFYLPFCKIHALFVTLLNHFLC